MNFEPILSWQPWTNKRLIHKCAIALGLTIDRSTKLTYNSGTNSYLTFCHLHNRLIDPTPETLSFFTVFISHHINPKLVDNYLSDICNNLEGFFLNICATRNSPLVSHTLASCKWLHSHPPHCKCALTQDDLHMVHNCLANSTSHNDMPFLTQLLTSFAALLSLGELIWPDTIIHRSYRKIILRTSVHLHDNTYHTAPDPIGPFLTSHDHLFPHCAELWLFENGTVSTQSWFLHWLQSYFPTDVADQSIWAGGATNLASRSFPPDNIMLIGHWLSDDWQKYIWRHSALMHTLYFSGSHTSPTSL
jgi:hypothetical protein